MSQLHENVILGSIVLFNLTPCSNQLGNIRTFPFSGFTANICNAISCSVGKFTIASCVGLKNIKGAEFSGAEKKYAQLKKCLPWLCFSWL
tara:strand:+ start:194 stop:463 length:270 start_codon:yes stop_codon:yes gene_type:complete